MTPWESVKCKTGFHGETEALVINNLSPGGSRWGLVVRCTRCDKNLIEQEIREERAKMLKKLGADLTFGWFR